MKIGFVLDDGLDKPDGVQQNILTLGTWLQKQGHEVRYIVGETTRNDIPGIIILSKNIKVSFNGNRMSIPIFSSGRKITAMLRSENFDVIHVQVPYSPLMAGRLINRLDKKTTLIGTFHILPVGAASFYGTKILGKVLSSNLRRFDKHLAVSEPAQVFAKNSFNIESDTLPNPVDINKYKTSNRFINKTGNIRIVFLGRLVSRKGCEHLLNAIKNMADNYPTETNFHLDICGDGPQKNKLEAFVRKNKLEKHVTFHGFISEQQKINYLRQGDILVFPSVSGESFGIVLVEAMAAGGGVVIGGDNPGYRSVLGSLPDSLIKPMDTNNFSKKLSLLIDSKQARKQLFEKQQMLVGQFDVNVVGEKLLKYYKDCISIRKRR